MARNQIAILRSFYKSLKPKSGPLKRRLESFVYKIDFEIEEFGRSLMYTKNKIRIGPCKTEISKGIELSDHQVAL